MLLRTRIILGVSLAMLLLAVSLWFVNRYIASFNNVRIGAELTLSKSKLLEHILDNHRQLMRSEMTSLTRDKPTQAAIAAGDHKQIQDEVGTTFARLRDMGTLDDIIIVNKANKVLFHAPLAHDHLSESFQLQASLSQRKVFFGIIPHKERLALTLTFPLYQSNKLIGAVAYTRDIGSIIDEVTISNSTELLILDTELKPILQTSNTLYQPGQLSQLVETSENYEVWHSAGQSMGLTSFPLFDFQGKQLATMIIANNITRAHSAELQLSMTAHLMLTGGVLLFLIFLGLWLHRQFSPLSEAVRVLNELAKGDYSTELSQQPGDKDDEIGTLIKSIDIFRENLKWMSEEQKAERVRGKVLQEALNKQEELQYMQRQFVSMASHEFRTPLAIIDTVVHRLSRRFKKGSLPSDDGLEQIMKIRTAIERLTGLMERTLTAAHVEEGKIEIKLAPCNIRKLVLDTAKRQQEISPGHAITYEIEDLPDAIFADPGALEQVLTNLLSNAVKYSPDNPKVEVLAQRVDDNVFISVKDHGVGVDEEDLMRLGERFFRAKTSAGIVGTGIGLHLIRSLILQHDGILDIESEKGKGSIFKIRLPIKAEELEEYLASQEEQPSPPKSSVA